MTCNDLVWKYYFDKIGSTEPVATLKLKDSGENVLQVQEGIYYHISQPVDGFITYDEHIVFFGKEKSKLNRLSHGRHNFLTMKQQKEEELKYACKVIKDDFLWQYQKRTN